MGGKIAVDILTLAKEKWGAIGFLTIFLRECLLGKEEFLTSSHEIKETTSKFIVADEWGNKFKIEITKI